MPTPGNLFDIAAASAALQKRMQKARNTAVVVDFVVGSGVGDGVGVGVGGGSSHDRLLTGYLRCRSAVAVARFMCGCPP